MSASRVVFLTQNGTEIVGVVGQVENHKRGNNVTDFPVESGFRIADGAQAIPVTFNFTGIVPDDVIAWANRPKINLERVEAAYQRQKGGKIFNETNAPKIDYGVGKTLSQGVRDVIQEICDERIVVTIVTGFRVYVNMIMTELVEPADEETAENFKFSASFKQISAAESLTVYIDESNLAEDAVPSAATAADIGKQSTEEPDETTKTKGASVLSWLTGVKEKP